MTPLITLREPVVAPSVEDHEEAFRLARSRGWSEDLAAIWAASVAGLPTVDDEGDSIAWTMRAVRHLVFLARLVADRRLGGDTETDR